MALSTFAHDCRSSVGYHLTKHSRQSITANHARVRSVALAIASRESQLSSNQASLHFSVRIVVAFVLSTREPVYPGPEQIRAGNMSPQPGRLVTESALRAQG